MKNHFVLFLLLMALYYSSFGQVKVIEGKVVAGNVTTNPTEQFHVDGNISLLNPLNDGSVSGKKNAIYGVGGHKRMTMQTDITTEQSLAFFSMFGTETQVGGNPPRAGEFNMAGKYVQILVGNTNTSFGVKGLEIKSNKDLYAYTANTFKEGNSNWTVISDRNLKTGIRKYEDGLEKVLQIEPIWFSYNGEAATSIDREYVGVIAQDFQKIAPYAIDTFTYEDLEKTTKEQYLSVNDSAVKYMVVNAIKEQQIMIEELQETVRLLQEQVRELKTQIK